MADSQKELDLSYSSVIPDIQRCRHISRLDLSGNQLRNLPSSLGFLRELTWLDLSDNPIHSLKMVVEGLATIPRLTDLKIHFQAKTTEKDMSELIARVPQLRRVNGISVREAKKSNLVEAVKNQPKKETAKYVIREEDIEEFQILVDCITALYKEEDADEGQNIKTECGRFLKKKIEELGVRVKNTTNLRHIQLLNLRAVHGIYHFAFFKVINFVEKYVEKRISMVLRMVYNSMSASFEGVNDILGDTTKSEAALRASTQKLKHELTDLTMLDHTVGVADRSDNNIFREMKEDFDKIDTIRETTILDMSQTERETAMALTEPSAPIEIDKRLLTEPKRMTFMHLNELINELIETKIKMDIRNLESGLPKRTMEGHIHEIFKNKFGLKGMTTEQLASFLHTLRYYAGYETRARAFLAIVRNECEEEFLHAIRSIETSLVVLLKMFLYGGQPYAPEKKINALVNSRINSVISMSEAKEVVQYLYVSDDADELFIRIEGEKEYPNESKVLSTREEKLIDREKTAIAVINYKRFRRIITNYVFEGHTTYLQPFIRIFSRFDTDHNGVLNEAEFRKMITYIVSQVSYGLNATNLLVHLDPFSSNMVTFSSCVTILSQIVTNKATGTTLLSDLHG